MLDNVDDGNHLKVRIERQLFNLPREDTDSPAGRVGRCSGRLDAVFLKMARQTGQKFSAAATHVEYSWIPG
jgi:hypothetical protein